MESNLKKKSRNLETVQTLVKKMGRIISFNLAYKNLAKLHIICASRKIIIVGEWGSSGVYFLSRVDHIWWIQYLIILHEKCSTELFEDIKIFGKRHKTVKIINYKNSQNMFRKRNLTHNKNMYILCLKSKYWFN